MMMVGFENVVRQTFAVWDFKSAPFEKPSSPEKNYLPKAISSLSPHSRVGTSWLKDGHCVILQVVSEDEPEQSKT